MLKIYWFFVVKIFAELLKAKKDFCHFVTFLITSWQIFNYRNTGKYRGILNSTGTVPVFRYNTDTEKYRDFQKITGTVSVYRERIPRYTVPCRTLIYIITMRFAQRKNRAWLESRRGLGVWLLGGTLGAAPRKIWIFQCECMMALKRLRWSDYLLSAQSYLKISAGRNLSHD